MQSGMNPWSSNQTVDVDRLFAEFGIEPEQVPALATAALREIMEKPSHYTSNGLLSPPVWFIRVRVERVERLRDGVDVRD